MACMIAASRFPIGEQHEGDRPDDAGDARAAAGEANLHQRAEEASRPTSASGVWVISIRNSSLILASPCEWASSSAPPTRQARPLRRHAPCPHAPFENAEADDECEEDAVLRDLRIARR